MKMKKNFTETYNKKAEISKLYNSAAYKRLRETVLMECPICVLCAKEQKTTLATEVHHMKYISDGRTLEEMTQICMDKANLIPLCTEHHHFIHNNNIKLK